MYSVYVCIVYIAGIYSMYWLMCTCMYIYIVYVVYNNAIMRILVF